MNVELPHYLAGLEPTNYTILVVDDTATNLRVVADYLSEIGFRVLLARSGESGIQRALHGKPDLILLDVLMPGIDGFETCARLKNSQDTSHIPVIIMTALAEVEHKVKGFQVGAVDYVTKPIQHQEMLARIATHLRISDLTFGLEREVESRTAELEQAMLRAQQLSKELEQALGRERALSALQSRIIEVVSHEFLTPLTSIQQSATLLAQLAGKLPEEKRLEAGTKIKEAVRFMSRLLGDVFFINAIETQKLPMQTEEIALGAYCRQLQAKLAREYASEGDIRIQFSPADGRINVDRQLLDRLLDALISNALKFSNGTGTVSVRLGVRDDRLIGVVDDEGIGIPDQALAQVFDPFYRAPNANPRRGLGVGLYICRLLTETMGGKISVARRDDHPGTRFTFNLPAQA